MFVTDSVARSIPPGSTARESATFSTHKAMSPASPTRKSEPDQKENAPCLTKNIRRGRHHRNRRHRRELGVAVPAKGLDVIATDIAPDAETSCGASSKPLAGARRLGSAPGASQSRLTFTPDMPAALRGADFVQENGPERIDFKKKLYRQLDELFAGRCDHCSSSSGLTMSEIQSIAGCTPSAA